MVQLSNFVGALAEMGYCRRSPKMRSNVFTGAETIFQCPARLPVGYQSGICPVIRVNQASGILPSLPPSANNRQQAPRPGLHRLRAVLGGSCKRYRGFASGLKVGLHVASHKVDQA